MPDRPSERELEEADDEQSGTRAGARGQPPGGVDEVIEIDSCHDVMVRDPAALATLLDPLRTRAN